MPYRVIIAGGDTDRDCGPGTYVSSQTRPPVERVAGDSYSLHTYADAGELCLYMRRCFPNVRYEVVGQWNAADWDGIAARYQTGNLQPIPVDVERTLDSLTEDEDERDPCWCGDDEHDEYEHVNHYCDNCEWSCELHECRDCVSYGPDRDWCEACADEYRDEEGGSEGSPGLRLTECTTCHSYDVHHDDIAEAFVCDCRARRLIADKRPVTLAHDLAPAPELEAVA